MSTIVRFPQVVYDVAETLECAAIKGFFHRDVKPANIVEHDGHAWLIDWHVSSEGGYFNGHLTGTTMFLPLRLKLCDMDTKLDVADDLESLLYTALYLSVTAAGHSVLGWEGEQCVSLTLKVGMMACEKDVEKLLGKCLEEHRAVFRELHKLFFPNGRHWHYSVATSWPTPQRMRDICHP